ncbi:hypothetical protein PLICRDRAFT_179200 [Plicaturopsis crispa FD-325 SS-3]|uniref:Uncharacterized protein n=1 Tax=Plicaturopsis crispa FD-325 SS-3 TaxID=944288 RepID=A0A0C9SL50_PLICR|nr:hypothetical protein PLICRDRAFT_179200 [Plicaturopsis crispa FD-325 SS-3]
MPSIIAVVASNELIAPTPLGAQFSFNSLRGPLKYVVNVSPTAHRFNNISTPYQNYHDPRIENEARQLDDLLTAFAGVDDNDIKRVIRGLPATLTRNNVIISSETSASGLYVSVSVQMAGAQPLSQQQPRFTVNVYRTLPINSATISSIREEFSKTVRSGDAKYGAVDAPDSVEAVPASELRLETFTDQSRHVTRTVRHPRPPPPFEADKLSDDVPPNANVTNWLGTTQNLLLDVRRFQGEISVPDDFRLSGTDSEVGSGEYRISGEPHGATHTRPFDSTSASLSSSPQQPRQWPSNYPGQQQQTRSSVSQLSSQGYPHPDSRSHPPPSGARGGFQPNASLDGNQTSSSRHSDPRMGHAHQGYHSQVPSAPSSTDSHWDPSFDRGVRSSDGSFGYTPSAPPSHPSTYLRYSHDSASSMQSGPHRSISQYGPPPASGYPVYAGSGPTSQQSGDSRSFGSHPGSQASQASLSSSQSYGTSHGGYALNSAALPSGSRVPTDARSELSYLEGPYAFRPDGYNPSSTYSHPQVHGASTTRGQAGPYRSGSSSSSSEQARRSQGH